MQTLPSSQPRGDPPTQTPALQASEVVQALPSLQEAVLLTWTQPDAGSQLSSVHTFPSSQLRAGPPTQAPAAQRSPVVQASPSLHGAVLCAWTQPAAGSQLSSVQTLPSSQPRGDPATQTPPLQESTVVHGLPSLQEAVLLAWAQPEAGSQLSSVHTFPSSQSGAGPPTQAPPLQVSAVVQASASSHELVLFT